MLFLLFKIGEEGYAINSADIVEVLPCLATHKISNTPDYIKGIANYRGESIPVIDSGTILNDRPCKKLLSTRIILVRLDRNCDSKKVGILAESATETIKVPAANQSEYENDGPFYFDSKVIGQTMFQLFDPRQVLPPDIEMTLSSIQRHTAGRPPL